MRITELLKKESIELGVTVSTKEEAIDRLISLMDAGGRLKDKAGYIKKGFLPESSWGVLLLVKESLFPMPRSRL